jgi:hypothetical protein
MSALLEAPSAILFPVNAHQALIWETFVVRLWRETAGSTWRGQIVHLPDRETAYFAAVSQAVVFMSRFVPEIDHLDDTADQSNTAIDKDEQA